MTATIEFDLENEEDSRAFERCVRAKEMALVLFEFDQLLRNQAKHQDSQEAGILREQLHTMMSGSGIDLDNLLI